MTSKEVDFHIDVKPVSISLECPHCDTDITISWKYIDVPEYWVMTGEKLNVLIARKL